MQPNCWLEPAHGTSMINACFLEATKIISKFKTCTYSSEKNASWRSSEPKHHGAKETRMCVHLWGKHASVKKLF